MSDISERFRPLIFGPYATLSKIVFGNGFGFWKTMPMRRRTSAASTFDPYRLSPWYITDPEHLRARRDVVHAVETAQDRGLAATRRPDERGDLLGGDVELDLADRGVAAVLHLDVAELEDELARPFFARLGGLGLRLVGLGHREPEAGGCTSTPRLARSSRPRR